MDQQDNTNRKVGLSFNNTLRFSFLERLQVLIGIPVIAKNIINFTVDENINIEVNGNDINIKVDCSKTTQA